jgi:hypothetical protein
LELKVPLIQSVDRIQQFFEDRNGIKNIQMGLFKLEVKDYPIVWTDSGPINGPILQKFGLILN